MNGQTWWLLYRREGLVKVWAYEPLPGKVLNRMIREGWRVVE